MTLWLTLALMTAAAVFAVLWPLGRRGLPVAGRDVLVYRDQLAELDRDRAAGLIGATEAEAARVEIARRLLAADVSEREAGQAASPLWRRRAAMLVGLVLLPAGVAGLYLALGSPQLPDAPLAARLGGPAESRPLDSLVAQVEAHLERNPEDGRGWEVLAPVYARLGRLEDAVKARRNALRINGATAAREGDYGEALMGAANGIVTADAKAAFERARKHDPEDVKARYFLGVVAEQDGRPQEAAAIWRDMLAKAPADAPWTGFIRQSLARLGQAPIADEAGPNAAEVAAAAELSPEQRTEMVRGMVDRLAARLQQDGADVDGWLRLMRAYSVLGEAEKAKAAAADARRALSGDPDKLRRVDELARALSLGG